MKAQTNLMIALLIGMTLFTACEKEALMEQEVLNPNTPTNNTSTNNTQNMTYEEDILYVMPSEEEEHEGTWLQWPHYYGYDETQVERYEHMWIAMTKALHTGENVHIIVYDNYEKNRVKNVLIEEGVNMSKVDFLIAKTDDVWVRDNGPIFVYDENDELVITDWEFNGWGEKTEYFNCNKIPAKVSQAKGFKRVHVDMVNEGGSVEIDGNGTLMAKKSSILNNNRNPGWSLEDIEYYFTSYLGVTNFIWLEGVKGLDITDDHIDGTARFAHGNTIVTIAQQDSDPEEFEILQNATNKDGEPYQIVELPLTQYNVPGTGDKGSYANYYVGNEVVIVQNFEDPMDQVANEIIQNLFPNKTVVPVDGIELWIDGGGPHCVTQQQPLGIN